MAISRPVNAGYHVVMGNTTGSASFRGTTWLEWKVISQDQVHNRSTIRFYLYLSRSASTSSTWSNSGGGYGWISVDGNETNTANNVNYDIRNEKANSFGWRDLTLTHNTDGTKRIQVGARLKTKSTYISGGDVSTIITLPAIDRAGILGNIPEMQVDDAEYQPRTVSIPIVKYNKTFRHQVEVNYKGETVFSIYDHTSNDYTLTLENLRNIYNAIDTNYVNATVTLTTYQSKSSDVQVGNKSHATVGMHVSATDRSPRIKQPAFDVEENNEYAKAITGGRRGVFIKGISDVKLTVLHKATGTKGAGIGNYDVGITVNGEHRYLPYRAIPASDTFSKIKEPDVGVMFTDNRGNVSYATDKCVLWEYTKPTITGKASRGNSGIGEVVQIKGTGRYTIFENALKQNEIVASSYRVREYPDGKWGPYVALPYTNNKNGTYSWDHEIESKFDVLKRYQVEVGFKDALDQITTTLESVQDTTVTLDIDTNSRSLGVGRVISSATTKKGSLEVDGDLVVHGNMVGGYGFVGCEIEFYNNMLTDPSKKLGGSWELRYFDHDRIFVGSQMLYDYFNINDAGTHSLIGAYSDFLISGLHRFQDKPAGYHAAYRASAQATTAGSTPFNIMINNVIVVNGVTTYSGGTFRVVDAGKWFKHSEITLEPTFNYPSTAGMNLKVKVHNTIEGPKGVIIRNIMLHGVWESDVKMQKWVRIA